MVHIQIVVGFVASCLVKSNMICQYKYILTNDAQEIHFTKKSNPTQTESETILSIL
jgi:hypothetical protein